MKKNSDITQKLAEDIVKDLSGLNKTDILFKNVCSIVKCPRLLTYCRRLITSNSKYIDTVSETSIKTCRNGEKLNIDIDLNKNNFMLLTTEWNQSDINRIYYEKDEEGYTFTIYNNDISYNDGINRTVVKTLFDDKDKLIYTAKEVETNLDFYIGKDHRIVNKRAYIEIFIYNNQEMALQRTVYGDNIKYYLIEQVPILLITDTNFFNKVNNCLKVEIDEATFTEMKGNDPKSLMKVIN